MEASMYKGKHALYTDASIFIVKNKSQACAKNLHKSVFGRCRNANQIFLKVVVISAL